MTDHLTEDRISSWVVGRSTAEEQNHVQACRTCTAEVDGFQKTLSLFRAAIWNQVDRQTDWGTDRALAAIRHRSGAQASLVLHFVETPSLLGSLKRAVIDTLYRSRIETTAAPVEVEEIWSKSDSRYSNLFSLLLHAAIVGILLIPVAVINPPAPTETSVMLLKPASLILNVPNAGKSGGGGGGGMNTPTPPSKGVPPRGADKQLAPPMVEAKNLNPDLIVEPTIVAPQLASLPQFNINTIGDPNGVSGPPSAGPGKGGGVGTGTGRGVGEGDGPGLGPGGGGGVGGGVFNVGGGVTEPRIRLQPQPEYSEDGRKARAQGAVEMLVVVKADGSVEFRELTKRLGYGLDQKAIEAVSKWKFEPAKKDGKSVAVFVSIIVNFTLR
jgi:periplasmic protein TonB